MARTVGNRQDALVSDEGFAESRSDTDSPRETLVGRRVLVTGIAGAGKSTFSRALSAQTGLPAVHLDVHFWKPGWVEPSEDEWSEKQRGLLASDEWILDGNYHATLDLRLRVQTRSWSWIRHGGSVHDVHSCAGFGGVQLASSYPKAATSPLCDDYARSGFWPGESGGFADLSRELELRILSRHRNLVTVYVLRSRRTARDFVSASVPVIG